VRSIRRLLLATHRPKAPAGSGAAKHVFADRRKGDEHEERQGYRADLPVDDVHDRRADVAAGAVAQQKAQSLKADIHRERRGDGGEIREPDKEAVDEAGYKRADEHQREAQRHRGGRLIVVDEKRSHDDEEASQRAYRQVDAAH
jgi:hypothetical protein